MLSFVVFCWIFVTLNIRSFWNIYFYLLYYFLLVSNIFSSIIPLNELLSSKIRILDVMYICISRYTSHQAEIEIIPLVEFQSFSEKFRQQIRGLLDFVQQFI